MPGSTRRINQSTNGKDESATLGIPTGLEGPRENQQQDTPNTHHRGQDSHRTSSFEGLDKTSGSVSESNPAQKYSLQRHKTKHSAFAESLEEKHVADCPLPTPASSSDVPPANTAVLLRRTMKLEPREEPHGWRGRDINPNLEIGLASFLREQPRADPARKSVMSTVFPSRSNSERRRRFLGPRKQTTGFIASRRMSDGRGAYGHIVVGDFYEGTANASTYRVNEVEDSKRIIRMKGRRMVETSEGAGTEGAADGTAGFGAGEKSGGEKKVAGGMADEDDDDRTDSTSADGGHGEPNFVPQPRSISPAPVLPLRKAAESTFGVDFSSILKRHEESTGMTPTGKRSKRGSINTSIMTRSESRPNVRDFAEDSRSRFLTSPFRRRSRSPKAISPAKLGSPKKEGRKMSEAEEPQREAPDFSVYRRQINSIRDSVAQHAVLASLVPVDPAAPSKQLQIPATNAEQPQINAASARNSAISNSHSKTASGRSTASGVEDNFSDISSAVISDAQSVLLQRPRSNQDGSHAVGTRKPAGPAPTGPLPSLPEGVDVQPPATPRLSESSQRMPSPERSPGKNWNKTSTRYKLTPTETYPPRRPPSPERRNAAKEADQLTRKPAALVRIQSTNIRPFPSPPPSPDRVEVKGRKPGNLEVASADMDTTQKNHLDQRNERTKMLKARDLAKEKSLAATSVDEPQPPVPKLVNGTDGHHGTIERFIESYGDVRTPDPPEVQNTLQASSLEPASLPPSTEQRETIGPRISNQAFSPIVTVAEQTPSAPVESPQSTNPLCQNGDEIHLQVPRADAVGSEQPPIVFEEVFLPDNQEDEQMPEMMESKHRRVSTRVPTPFNPLMLRNDNYPRSSPRSSYAAADNDLEARMTAMEKKNQLLEQAFLAVVDASASMSIYSDGGSVDGDGLSGSVTGSSNNKFEGNNGRESGGSRHRELSNDKLASSLERLLARHGSTRISGSGAA